MKNQIQRLLMVTIFVNIIGCASTLKSKSGEIKQLEKGHGVAFGSIILNLKESERSFGDRPLTDNEWFTIATPSDRNFLEKYLKLNQITLVLESDGIEVPFIASLPERSNRGQYNCIIPSFNLHYVYAQTSTYSI